MLQNRQAFTAKKAQQKLEPLLSNIRLCNVCENQLPLGARPIIQLHGKAKVLIASQAPGSVAHASGIPFKDKSGERLRAWMGLSDDMFYDPEKVAILPMGFCYPGRGKSGDLPPSKECAPLWRKQVLSLLPNIETTLLIGAYSQHWHLANRRETTLTSTVMNWQNYEPDFFPLPHPSPRNNIWMSKNAWFERDVIPKLQQRISDILSF